MLNENLIVEISKLEDYGADTKGAIDRFVGDKELYVECVNMFLTDEKFSQLDLYYKSKDYDHLFEAAHSLKGVSGNLGLTPFYHAVCNFVEVLRNKKYENLDDSYKTVITKKAELVNYLKG